MPTHEPYQVTLHDAAQVLREFYAWEITSFLPIIARSLELVRNDTKTNDSDWIHHLSAVSLQLPCTMNQQIKLYQMKSATFTLKKNFFIILMTVMNQKLL